MAASYEAVAKLAAKLGCPAEDTTIRALVQRLGAKAEAHVQARLKQTPAAKETTRAPTALAVLMHDGFQVASHTGRMNYQALARRGWPIGSGAVESGCHTRPCRRKRPSQFWTKAGLRHLDALEEARDNGHWDHLWLTA